MSIKHQYTLKLYCDDGHQASIDLLVGNKADLTYLQGVLAYGINQAIGESYDIEPEPFDRVDDLRDMLSRNDKM